MHEGLHAQRGQRRLQLRPHRALLRMVVVPVLTVSRFAFYRFAVLPFYNFAALSYRFDLFEGLLLRRRNVFFLQAIIYMGKHQLFQKPSFQNLAYFLKRLVLKQQVFPRINIYSLLYYLI